MPAHGALKNQRSLMLVSYWPLARKDYLSGKRRRSHSAAAQDFARYKNNLLLRPQVAVALLAASRALEHS